ncbi:MAG: hypothetical protein ACLRXQ_09580 [Phascolarctobacterium faecium]
MRINDRVSRRQNIRRRVMIGNDDLSPAGAAATSSTPLIPQSAVTKSVVPASAKDASASLFSP